MHELLEDQCASDFSKQELDTQGPRSIRMLRFSDRLEWAYDTDQPAARRRHLLITGLIGLALADLFLIYDRQLVPDVFAFDCTLRFFVFTPLGLAVALLGNVVRPVIREALWGAMAFSAVALVLLVETVSACPDRGTYGLLAVLVMIFTATVQRLRFRLTIVTLVAIDILYSVVVISDRSLPSATRVSDIVFIATGSILIMLAGYTLEREHRVNFLLALRGRIINAELERAALVDPLTGLWNRRHLTTVMETAWAASGTLAEVALVLIDVDNFKLFNDTLGHLEGDKCLQAVAQCIRATIERRSHCAFRFGGEEFIVFLPDTTAAEAAAFAERVRQAVRQLSIAHPALGPAACVTASFGIAAAQNGSASAAELIFSADQALYQAKSEGRNRVTIYASGEPSATGDRRLVGNALNPTAMIRAVPAWFAPSPAV